MDVNDFQAERDQVVGETPKAQRAGIATNNSKTGTKKTDNSVGEIRSVVDDSVGLDDRKTAKEPMLFDQESPSKTGNCESNPVTPNLDRVKAFFRNKRTLGQSGSPPTAQVLQLQSSPLDTPRSQRVKPDFGPRKISPTSLISNMRKNQAPDLSRDTSGFMELNEDYHEQQFSPDQSHIQDQTPPPIVSTGLGRDQNSFSRQQSKKIGDLVSTNSSNASKSSQRVPVFETQQVEGLQDSQAKPLDTDKRHFSNSGGHQTVEISTQPIDTTDEKVAVSENFDGSATQVDLGSLTSVPIPEVTDIASDYQSPLVTRFTSKHAMFSRLPPVGNSTPSQLIVSPSNEVIPLSSLKASPVNDEQISNHQHEATSTPSRVQEESKHNNFNSDAYCLPEDEVELNESEKRIRLRFSNVYEQYMNCEKFDDKVVNGSVVYSDVEKTQELPEVEEGPQPELIKDPEIASHTVHESNVSTQRFDTQDITSHRRPSIQDSFEASQGVVKNRRVFRKKRHGRLKLNDFMEDTRPEKDAFQISPKRSKTEIERIQLYASDLSVNRGAAGMIVTAIPDRNDIVELKERQKSIQEPVTTAVSHFPGEIRITDGGFLTRKDIRFPDAVWCHYDFNYMYYPGRIWGGEPHSNEVEVLFESGLSTVKREDLHYLDVTVGETIMWEGKSYAITALECRSPDESKVIRCVRGYDTVQLKRKNKNGELGKRTLTKALSSITLTVALWAKRPKIILSSDFQNREEAFEDLRHPIRGRKYTTLVTPLSPSKELIDNAFGPESLTDQYASYSSVQDNKVEFKTISTNLRSTEGRGIFHGCLFVLSGLSDRKRDYLSSFIEQEEGIVSKMSFSSIISFIPKVHTIAENLDLSSLKFAGLITEKHSRSLKYLETIALGWPPLHYNFVEHCVRVKKLDWTSIFQFLLPAGESFRLGSSFGSKSSVIKSSNIFHFYLKLFQQSSLEDNINSRTLKMSNYHVIVCGTSDLDKFVSFAFHASGAASVNFCGTGESFLNALEADVESQELDSIIPGVVKESLKTLPKNSNVLLFLNSKSEKNLPANVIGKCIKLTSTGHNIYMEGKEWLIQTIINEDTALSGV
ncbi:LAME_0D09010g1_1 [Lachancea meyersii CBS 8951]|uniref:LAME_0D09010g1_1 n=1 Tax=Lachancea meyersii CBS 8951 TaxID=1266667 RepID=A0A1G4JB34_9SACH|nr:LAME_0D09010g1_1 [Lachancea meyersii CBS 8951]